MINVNGIKKLRTTTAVLKRVCSMFAIVSLIIAGATVFIFDPVSGLVSSHSMLVVSIWVFIMCMIQLVRYSSAKYNVVLYSSVVKSLLLAVVASFPIPALVLLLPRGGVDVGDVLVVALLSSLLYMYITRSLTDDQ